MEGFIMAKSENEVYTEGELVGEYRGWLRDTSGKELALKGADKNKKNPLCLAFSKWQKEAAELIKVVNKKVDSVASYTDTEGRVVNVLGSGGKDSIAVFYNLPGNLSTLAKMRHTEIEKFYNAANDTLLSTFNNLKQAQADLVAAKKKKIVPQDGKTEEELKTERDNSIQAAKNSVDELKKGLKAAEIEFAKIKKLKAESKKALKGLKVDAMLSFGVASYKTYGHHLGKMQNDVNKVLTALEACNGKEFDFADKKVKDETEYKNLMKALKESNLKAYKKVLLADMKPQISVDHSIVEKVNGRIESVIVDYKAKLITAIKKTFLEIKSDKSLSTAEKMKKAAGSIKDALKSGLNKIKDRVKSLKDAESREAYRQKATQEAQDKATKAAEAAEARDAASVVKQLKNFDNEITKLLAEEGVTRNELVYQFIFASRLALYGELLINGGLFNDIKSIVNGIKVSEDLYRMIATLKYWWICICEFFKELPMIKKCKKISAPLVSGT